MKRWFLAVVLASMLVGFGVRWANIAVVKPICDPPRADPDPQCYELYAGISEPLYGHLQGRLIAQGEWFVNPFHAIGGTDTSFEPARALAAEPVGELRRSVGDPPLYQIFLGALSAVGIESGQAQRHASAIVGLTTIALLALLARRLAGDLAGAGAAVVAALHPLLWINDAMLLSESIYGPLIAGSLLAAVAFRDTPSVRRVVVLSLVVTLAAFARAEAAILLPVLVAPVVLLTRSVPWRTRAGLAAIAAGVAGIFFLPWNLWLNSEFEERVFMTSASGQVLSTSACDEHFYGEPTALFIYCAVDVDLPPGLDESQRDARKRDAAVEYLEDNARRIPVVTALRVGRMWDFYGPSENLSMNIAIEDRGAFASRTGLAVYYALWPFAIVGVVSLWRRKELVVPYLGVAVMVTVTAALTFGLTRYRIPADITLIPLAAVGADAVAHAVAARGR
ncbi:MAG: glycosyltransferase family 39 protein [Acidimicrobiales bacterium]